MQRNPVESQEHEGLIRMMVRHFSNEGYRNIKADIPGVPSPDIVYGTRQNHVPDMTADKNGTRIILEAETSNSLSVSHTSSQWSLFADAASKSRGQFHVVVPRGSRSAAEKRASDLGIVVHTIWTPA